MTPEDATADARRARHGRRAQAAAAEPPRPTRQGRGPRPGAPADAMIVVPVRNTVLFPEIVFPITIGRPLSVAAAQAAVREQRQMLIVLQKDPSVDEPGPDDLHASARSPTSCATSPRPTAATT